MSIKTTIPLDGNVDNTFKVTKADSPCCGDGLTMCKYTAALTIGTYAITEIHLDSGNTVIPVVGAGLTAAGTADAIVLALKNAGYIAVPDAFPSLSYTVSGTTMNVTMYSDVNVFNAMNSNSDDYAFTAACTQTSACTFTKTGIVSSTTDTVTVNGVTSDIIDIVAGTTTTAAIDTSITAAFTAAGVTAAVVVTSTGSGGSTVYTATITAPQDTRVKYNGTTLSPTGCGVTWTA